MPIAKYIYKIRTDAGLSQEKFAEILNVSRQAVQKWESGAAQPDIGKLMGIAKHFGVSLDDMLFGNSQRIKENNENQKKIIPCYEKLEMWEFYAKELETEYRQCVEEGRDIEKYKELFAAVAKMEPDYNKKKMADVLFDIVLNSPVKDGYKYNEPSSLEEIKALRKSYPVKGGDISRAQLFDKIYGAWLGRICGCMLGKPVEGMHTDELIPLLKETDNYPMHRYIFSTDGEKVGEKIHFPLQDIGYVDITGRMPADDDTNYTVMSNILIERYGRDFKPEDVATLWIQSQSKSSYCTAERVAFVNFVNGYYPPDSAIYKNPYREWIGAQIRGDYFGYINPGNPELAADMAWRDASISHVKNGIYGEMFISAMIACAAVTTDITEIIRGGLGEIPATSRLYDQVQYILDFHASGKSCDECFADIHRRYDEFSNHDWCHTISNAEIVTASLLYGGGDFGRTICLAVQTGFDTDCNGATAGSILGMRGGSGCIGKEWSEPLNDKLDTTIFGVGAVKISEMAKKTMDHVIYP